MGKCNLWRGNVLIKQIIGKLSATNHHFKYIVNCIILAAGGNGMDVAGLCYWDQEMDGSVTVKWDNKHMTCIVNVFGCAIWSYSYKSMRIIFYNHSRKWATLSGNILFLCHPNYALPFTSHHNFFVIVWQLQLVQR